MMRLVRNICVVLLIPLVPLALVSLVLLVHVPFVLFGNSDTHIDERVARMENVLTLCPIFVVSTIVLLVVVRHLSKRITKADGERQFGTLPPIGGMLKAAARRAREMSDDDDADGAGAPVDAPLAESFDDCLKRAETRLEECSFDAALEALELAKRLRPASPLPWIGIAAVRHAEGDRNAAERALDEAAEVAPDHLQAYVQRRRDEILNPTTEPTPADA